MIKIPLTKKDKKHNQQSFYTYACKKEVVDHRDALARIAFERKPYYIIEKEKIDDARS